MKKLVLYGSLILGVLYLYSASKVLFIDSDIKEYELFFNWKVGKTVYLTIKIILGLVFISYFIGNRKKIN